MLKLLTIRCAYEYVLRISAGTVFTHSAGTVQTKDAGPNYVARVLSSQLHYVQSPRAHLHAVGILWFMPFDIN